MKPFVFLYISKNEQVTRAVHVAIYCGSREEECLHELRIVSQKGNFLARLRKFMGNFIDNWPDCGKIRSPPCRVLLLYPPEDWTTLNSVAILVENTLWN